MPLWARDALTYHCSARVARTLRRLRKRGHVERRDRATDQLLVLDQVAVVDFLDRRKRGFRGMSEDREEKLGEMEEHYAHMSTESAERLLGYWQTCQARQQLPHC